MMGAFHLFPESNMGFAILRTQKLKSGIAVRRSMKHAFREQDTPNADPARVQENTHLGAADVDEALKRFNARLPAKVRSNAVLAVEYLITASPEDMKGKSRQEQDAYFRDGLKWLQQRHGAENVVYAGIHRDETTPHMYAYVVPLDRQGKLNCRAFLGGAQALREMQTDFAEKVGQQHGLQRGLEGSKARHTSIQHYYARVNEATPKTPSIDVPEAKLLEGKETYGRRVAQSVLDQMGPEVISLQAKAAHADLAKRQAAAAEKARADAELRFAQRERLLELERGKVAEHAKQLNTLKAILVNGGEKLVQVQNELREHYRRLTAKREHQR
jgi:hypothetical protein